VEELRSADRNAQARALARVLLDLSHELDAMALG
jgi:hypothetical protein